jgi:hypothetical protein
MYVIYCIATMSTLSRVRSFRVTNKTGLGLDLIHLIHSQLATTGSTAVSLITLYTVHRCTRTKIPSLH